MSVVRYRRAMVVLASAGGNTVEVIARLVQTSPDRVREMIHRFNDMGMKSLDPQWAGGRPRRITTEDEAFIVSTAKQRPEKAGQPFTHWSIRKLRRYLADNPLRRVTIGKERLRQILDAHGVTFQRTKTWKESNDPDKEAKLDRIEAVLRDHPDRVFAFDEFGPLAVHPVGGCCWAAVKKPQTPAGQLPQDLRRAAVPRLLLGGRRHHVGRCEAQEGHRQQSRTPSAPAGGPAPTARRSS